MHNYRQVDELPNGYIHTSAEVKVTGDQMFELQVYISTIIEEVDKLPYGYIRTEIKGYRRSNVWITGLHKYKVTGDQMFELQVYISTIIEEVDKLPYGYICTEVKGYGRSNVWITGLHMHNYRRSGRITQWVYSY